MIDTKLLRQKILDLAIRGKLVPQTPADEPASELLKKIKAEKEELVKAGKIKKDKHESFIFKGDDNHYYETIDGKTADITDEIPFDLPDGWAWCRQQSIITLISGQDFSPDGYNDSRLGIPYITGASNMLNRSIIVNRWTEHPSSIAVAGDILITCKGAGVGKMAYMDIPQAHVARQIMAIRPHCNIPSKFIEVVLQGQFITIREQMNGLIPGISRDVMLNLLFPLPPLAEQQRIVEQIEMLLGYVDIIDTDAETLEKSITLAKQKILDLAIRGKLVPQDPADEPASELLKKIKAEKEALVKAGKIKKDKHESFIFKGDDNCYYEQLNDKTIDITAEIPFDLPESWSWCRLYSVVEICDNLRKPINAEERQKRIKSANNLYPYYGATGQVGWIDDFISDGEFVLLGEDGAPFLDPCTPKAYIICGKAWINNHAHVLKGINNQFLCHCLNSVDYTNFITGTTRYKLTQAEMVKILLPTPPLAEQQRIVQAIAQYNSILELISK